jgi:two-component system, OmpR family, sensor histidine kinase BaeS
MRTRFIRRAWIFLLFFFALVFLASGLAVALLSGAFGVEERDGLVIPAGLLGLVLLAVLFAVGVRMVRRTAGPVGEVMEAAGRVADGDYEVRVPERGPRETRRLARSFNAMAERLAAGEEQRRRLLADVTHELRSPLAVIQGDVEGILDGVYGRDHLGTVLEETKVMSRLLDDLQTLSTAEAGALKLHRHRTDPGELIDDALAAIRSSAEGSGLRVERDVADGLPALDVDAVRIGEVLANLLHNAVRHTPPGGTVRVSADPSGDGAVAFAVEDTGTGIAAEALPHIFDRFVKGPGSSGAGLGLAIAKSLVEAHGGRIWAEAGPGGGAIMRFTLPPA